jgi:hypothetical protein
MHSALQRAAETNAARLSTMDTAESVLVILGKLRKHNPSLWTATGIEASAEDLVCEVCASLDAVAAPHAARTLNLEDVQAQLGVSSLDAPDDAAA